MATEHDRIDVLHEKLRNLHTVLNDDDADFDAWVAELANDSESAAHSAAVEYLELVGSEADKQKFIDAAHNSYGDGAHSFDGEPEVSPSENGAFVQCWVWVSNEAAGIASGYTAVHVDGEDYEYDADSVCFKQEDGDFEFWFDHGLTEPTVEAITALIRAANAGEKV